MTKAELTQTVLRLRDFLGRYRRHMGRKEVQTLVETYIRASSAESVGLFRLW